MSYHSSAGGGAKSYLVSFGDTRLGISICRFKQQAQSLGVFDNIFIYTEASLPLSFVEDLKINFIRQMQRVRGCPRVDLGIGAGSPK